MSEVLIKAHRCTSFTSFTSSASLGSFQLFSAAAGVQGFRASTQLDVGESRCCYESLREEPVVPVVNLTCVVPATVRGAENAMGGAYRSGPGALLLPATDGSNCAETHVSQALIMYAVCCMLLSRVPCGAVSTYIFSTSGAREWGAVGGQGEGRWGC